MKKSVRYIMLIVIGIGVAVAGWILGARQYATYDYIAPAPVLGVVVDENLIVVHVERNSAAERAGIQRGDSIEAFDSLSAVAQGAQIRESIQSVRSGSQHMLHIKRAGKKLAISIVPKAPSFNPQATPTPVISPREYY